MSLGCPAFTCVLMAVSGASWKLFCRLLLLVKLLFNVILGRSHRRAAQSGSVDYMRWQLAQQRTQSINWEAEIQVGDTVGTHSNGKF